MAGRHRQLRRTGFVVTAAGLSVLVVAGGAWAGYRELAKRCTTTVNLEVAAAPEIASAVRSAAGAWVKRDDTKVDGACITVAVTPTDPAIMAAAVSHQHGVSLVGVASGDSPPDPAAVDVWVPDSSTWLVRLGGEAAGFVPDVLGSIAESPVVLAVPQPSAGALGWPARTPTVKDLAAGVATGKIPRPGIVDPSHDATGLAGLLTFTAAAGTDAAAAALKVGVLRALSANSSSIRGDLLQKFPASANEIGSGVGLAPLSEADVIAFNRTRPAVGLAALYPKPATAVLDYPWAVMPGVDARKAAAASALRNALSAGAFGDELAGAGLRRPDGSTGSGFDALPGAPATVPPPATPADPKLVAGAIGQLLGSWAAITQPGRMLAVFDVSGSMKAPVPTAGGLTRAQVTQQTARQGLALLDGRWSVGNWTFSTDMVGTRPWVENLPIVSVATHLPELEAAIDKIKPKPGGDTGLFDTALAAYQRVQNGWQPGVSNSVVIYTDGKNDNPGGLTIDQLVARMTRLRDPKRPIRMIIIGIGTATDRTELEAITKAAGSGGVYIATDPAKIGEIFLQAIASRDGA